jgi:NDP-sugar pyrophosphorylase family protein
MREANLRALILAAGRGERLRPLTLMTPKPMLELGGHPLIQYPIAMLKRAGIIEIAINLHHLADKIQNGLGDGSELGVKIKFAPEPLLLGTGGPLNGLREFLGSDTFVIANSDTILNLDLAAMIQFHRSRGALATIALFSPANADYYSRLEIDADSRIRRMRLLVRRDPVEFDDYPKSLNDQIAAALMPFMYCGVLIAEPAALALMPEAAPWSLMTGLFAPMVAQGSAVFGYVHRGYFRTMDDLKSYETLKAEFANSPPPEIVKTL